jgi:hypothetical protein
MLGFKGFERDFVGLVARFIDKDVRTLCVVRGVSRTWREGTEKQWMKIQDACTLSFDLNVTVFCRNDKLLWKALMQCFDKNQLLACYILRPLMELYWGQNNLPLALSLKQQDNVNGVCFWTENNTGEIDAFFDRLNYRITITSFDYRQHMPALLSRKLLPLQFVEPYKNLFK